MREKIQKYLDDYFQWYDSLIKNNYEFYQQLSDKYHDSLLEQYKKLDAYRQKNDYLGFILVINNLKSLWNRELEKWNQSQKQL